MTLVTFGLKSIRISVIDSFFFDHSLYIVELIRSVVELTHSSNGELNVSPCRVQACLWIMCELSLDHV